ncbi:divergent polysaccharide deacetylase family protein [Neokomagataea tanensis]|uniref:divergent polysaccharide deacetylase family protein n=1 Tax=Neokomagataea TaxID=1223423 RepID=UPI0014770DD1|nr:MULTISPECIES: divergent polysaccharide deacetylase family protein [Neokomagataea]
MFFWAVILLGSAAIAFALSHTAPTPAAPKSLAKLPLNRSTQPPLPPPSVPSERHSPQISPLETARQERRIPLSILLGGYGYSLELSQKTRERLPSAIAFGVSPYLNTLANITTEAHTAQHELYMTLPMRSLDAEHTDTGAQTLGTGESPAHEEQKLTWWLNRTHNIAGMTDVTSYGCSQTDSAYLQSQEFHDIAQTIARHGLLYLSGQKFPARPINGMTATLCLNGDASPETLAQSYAALEQTLYPSGAILLVVTPLTPAVLESLSLWLQSPAASHFLLMPPSALADTPPQ